MHCKRLILSVWFFSVYIVQQDPVQTGYQGESLTNKGVNQGETASPDLVFPGGFLGKPSDINVINVRPIRDASALRQTFILYVVPALR